MLSERLLQLLKEKGFSELTEIQRLAIPAVETGANCLIIAPTGWGKTEAALLPLFDRFAKGEMKKSGIQILYITPMRSLNRDMLSRLEWWADALGISIAVRHGDTTQSERQKQARHPPQMLVTTPETLGAILPAQRIGEALKNVEHVVIDEVHELFGDKRGAQLTIALERLLEKREDRLFQRIGLSATIGNPDEVAAFLCGTGRECRIIRLPVERAMHLRVESPAPKEEDYALAEKLFIDGSAAARLKRVEELIRAHEATLVFVNTRSIAETLGSRLLKLLENEGGVNKVAVHHGSLSKDARVRAEDGFRGNEFKGLICTSSLELGVDIGHVDLVIQYSSPRQVQRLMQRVGRSGHSIARMPKGVVIGTDEDDLFEAAVIARRATNGLLESEEEQSGALDVLAQQIAGMLLEKSERSVGEITSVIKRAHPFAGLGMEHVSAVLKQLHEEGLVFFDEKTGAVKKNGRTRDYYYENLSMIPDERKYFVKSAVTNSNVAMLDEGFVANFVEPGAKIIARGIPWKVLDVGDNEVVVEPCEDITAAVPDWIGEEIPVPFDVAQEVGVLRRRIAAGENVKNEYFLSDEAMEKLAALIKKQAKVLVPDDKNILIEQTPDALVVHSLLGSKGNEAFARLLSQTLALHLGQSVRVEADPYRILIQAQKLEASAVARIIRETSPEYAESVVKKSIPNSNLFKYKFIHVAKAFGLIAKDADYKLLNMRKIMDALSGSPIYNETVRQFIHDYLDMKALRRMLESVKCGEVKLHAKKLSEPSPIASLALSKLSVASELIAPIEPASEILRSFKYATIAKQVKLFCTYCNSVHYRKISDVGENEKLHCPNCGSPMLAPVSPREQAFSSLQNKLKLGKRNFTSEEVKLRKELLRAAGLVQAYGRRALAALSVYGVGVETASRILQRLHRNEDLLFVDLLEAQKQFIRTKRYWQT